MSVRFVIRKEALDYHLWTLRDAICRNSDRHNFLDRYWDDECTGACDTFMFFSSAIRTAEAEAAK